MLQALSGVSSNPSLPAQGIVLKMAKTQILAEYAGRHIEWKAWLIDVMLFVTIYLSVNKQKVDVKHYRNNNRSSSSCSNKFPFFSRSTISFCFLFFVICTGAQYLTAALERSYVL